MSVKTQSDWEFECDISGCSLNEKVYYTKWRQNEPLLSFIEMLRIMAQVREESEKEEWERHMADEAYYAEKEKQLLEEEQEEEDKYKKRNPSLETIEESEEEEE